MTFQDHDNVLKSARASANASGKPTGHASHLRTGVGSQHMITTDVILRTALLFLNTDGSSWAIVTVSGVTPRTRILYKGFSRGLYTPHSESHGMSVLDLGSHVLAPRPKIRRIPCIRICGILMFTWSVGPRGRGPTVVDTVVDIGGSSHPGLDSPIHHSRAPASATTVHSSWSFRPGLWRRRMRCCQMLI